jgi:L-aspartate oxidase
MKRIVLDHPGDLHQMHTDVLIVGTGIAGLNAALSLDPHIRCLMINKSGIRHSNSMYAQGGIAAVIQPFVNDDRTELHYEDTLKAGAGLCNEEAVRVLVEEAWEDIRQLMQYDVPFDSDGERLLLTREGGHSQNRILHCGGDATGLHMTSALYQTVIKQKNIRIIEYAFLTDILTRDGKAFGILALDANENPIAILASKIIIASGGIGRVFRNSTNAICATGDGIAAAARANAALTDMEFVQFHPTALIHPSETGRFFLISEALRGEGGVLRNRRWDAFMKERHPLADLAPRDIVTRAIIMEMKKYDIPNVYLDITGRSRDFLRNRFPTIYQECMQRGLDIAKNWIPVMPVQHYFMGGIQTDISGRTSVLDLYACGEAACTGVHGANRLASNSLLECVVFSRRCAEDINKAYRNQSFKRKIRRKSEYIQAATGQNYEIDTDSFSSEIRALVTLKCGIIRNKTDLEDAMTRISGILEELEAKVLRTKKEIQTYNQASIALEIIKASLKRTKSVGAHFRSDEILDTGGIRP